jgi:hypothetical protein
MKGGLERQTDRQTVGKKRKGKKEEEEVDVLLFYQVGSFPPIQRARL